MTRRYDLAPFLALTGWTMSRVQEIAPCGGREWRRRKAEGVTEYIADRIATAAGLHPHNVWPEMHADAIAIDGKVCDECGERFVPARSIQRFCTRPCYRRHHSRKANGKYRRTEVGAAKNRERRRRYYRENREYERERERRRYWAAKAAAAGLADTG